TVETNFMTPFSASAVGYRVALAPDVERALTIGKKPDGGAMTIIDYFRGVPVSDAGGDAFRAPRAAKIGVSATWPVTPNAAGVTPLDAMINAVSPAYAIVMYGANDALQSIESLDGVAKRFHDHLVAVVDALESRGVIPILSTVPKHMCQ